MSASAHRDHKTQAGAEPVTLFAAHILDVGTLGSNHRGHGGKHAALVAGIDAQGGGELALDLVGPLHIDPALPLFAEIAEVGTTLVMHHHAAARAEGRNHRVAGDRPAALGKIHHHALAALNGQRTGSALLLVRYAVTGDQHPRHQARHAVTQADLRQQLIKIIVPQLFENLVELRLGDLRHAAVESFEFAVQQAPAKLHRLSPFQALEEGSNGRARLAGHHKIQPRWVRP